MTCAPPGTSSTEARLTPRRNLAPTGTGDGKADLAGAIVDTHRDARNPEDLGGEHRAERQREIAVCDRAAERAGVCPFDVDVDPLMVAGRFGECVDLLLGDLHVWGVAEVLADQGLESVDSVRSCGHGDDVGRLLRWPTKPTTRCAAVNGVYRSGFVTFVGRPNVGKSSMVNAICGRKISIVSDKPQTTRHRIMGVLTRPDSQIVFVDTPGLHKPVTALGERVNATALGSVTDVDVTALVLDATKPFGKGDRWVASQIDMASSIVVVNKIDRASPQQVLAMLPLRANWGHRSTFPVSALTKEGIDGLVEHLTAGLPVGPQFFPDDEVSDLPEERWVAELVREQLLAATRDELPYSIATQVVEWEWPRIRVDIIVERESQKGMVIGKGGSVLKRAGEAARRQLPDGVFLELRVKVDKDWQRRPDRVERLGY